MTAEAQDNASDSAPAADTALAVPPCLNSWENVEGFKAHKRRARKSAEKLWRRHARAVEAGDHHLAHALLKMIAASRSVALTAVVEANQTIPLRYRKGVRHRSTNPAERPALLERKRREQRELLETAQRLNIWEPCREPVYVKATLKPGKDKPRITQNFGVENRARQMIACRLLVPEVRPRAQPNLRGLALTAPNQYGLFRGGRNAAIEAVIQNMRDGFTTVIEHDLVDCFPSLDPIGYAGGEEHNAENSLVGLPWKIVRNLVASPDETDYRINRSNRGYREYGTRTISRLARQGLPQGSLLSPLIAEMMLSPIVRNIPDNERRRVVVIADNVLVMAKDRRTAEETTLSLRALLEAHPTGRLRLHSTQGIRRVSDGFEFLGYRIKYRKNAFDLQPLRKRRMDKLKELHGLLASYRERPSRTLWRSMRRLVVGFRSAYRHWTAPDEWRKAIFWNSVHVFGFSLVTREIAEGLVGLPRVSRQLPGYADRRTLERRAPRVIPFGKFRMPRAMPIYLL